MSSFSQPAAAEPPGPLGGMTRGSILSTYSKVDSIVAPLVDAWCERRLLRPLSYVLVSYPLVNPLTDGLAELRDALDKTRCFARSDLTELELDQLGEAIALLDQAIHRQ